MGLRSRRKGMRIEYLVRDLVRIEGYDADRVPASGAAQGFKGDIRVKLPKGELLLEVKGRKRAFSKVYSLFDQIRELHTPMQVFIRHKGVVFSISSTLGGVLVNPTGTVLLNDAFWGMADHVVKIQPLLGSADILVIKDDKKQPLFIRYFNV